jgi:dihydrofolate reductase
MILLLIIFVSYPSIMKGFSIVVSLNPATQGIGRGNQLPWRIKEDMAFFKRITTTAPSAHINAVIMGRKTWESLPASFRPLPGRKNVILSRDVEIREKLAIPSTVHTASTLAEALSILNTPSVDENEPKINDIFVIGGESIYREALQSEHCEKVYVTEVYGDFPELDTFFPVVPASQYKLTHRS